MTKSYWDLWNSDGPPLVAFGSWCDDPTADFVGPRTSAITTLYNLKGWDASATWGPERGVGGRYSVLYL